MVAVGVVALSLTASAQAQNNSWVDGNGKWETATNWSAGVAPSVHDATDLITNAGNKTVTIDATTSGSYPASMTISNLTVDANSLQLDNAGTSVPLHILNGLTIGSGGNLTIANSTLFVDPPLMSSDQFYVRGNVTLNSGLLLATNAFLVDTAIGGLGGASLTINGGQMLCDFLTVGKDSGSQGTLTVANGSITASHNLRVGDNAGSTGAVWITGGQMTITNYFCSIGYSGVGQMTVSNGMIQAENLSLSLFSGSSGTLTLAGGTITVSGTLTAGGVNTPGSIWVTGGHLEATNFPTYIGYLGVGQMTVSNGSVFARQILLGTNGSESASCGTLTVSGGTITLMNSVDGLRIGSSFNSTGVVIVTGGQIVTTNGTVLVGAAGTGQMTVSNGTATAKHVMIGAGTNSLGALTLRTGSTMNVSSNFIAAAGVGSAATVSIVGGQLVVTNGVVGVGNTGTMTDGTGHGQMTVSSNGILLASTILLGSSASGQGELTLADGGLISGSGTNGILVVNGFDQIGGDLSWTNIGSAMYCGYAHPGAYALSNGNSSCQDVYVGYDNAGTMTIDGGAMNILSRLIVGQLGSPLSTGTVWMTGGQLTVLNNYTTIGNSGVGQMKISNGTMTAASVIVGNSSNPGSLTVAGGTMTVLSDMTLGDCGGRMMGFVTITGGNLFVTNAAHNATLDVRSGAFIMTGGALVVDRLVMTNACGLFQRTGGTLQYSQLLLDPNLSAVGDGIPNSWKQKYGLDPFDPNLANEDSDGDGLSNLREYQLGTDPNNASSPFRITAIAREGNNIRVTWTTVGSTTNFVQVTAGTANGSYTNNFSDLSPELTIVGSTVTSTNYLDLNGAINSPSRYYRIRVLP
jgi:T5SS/PEP-CTERM-associated repeat protein